MMDGRIATTDGYLPLDGLLAYAWMAENHPELIRTDAGKNGEILEGKLPLEKRGTGDDWYWACSFACFTPIKETKVFWHKRFDAQHAEEYVDFGKRRGSVNIKSAQYKNYRMPLTIQLIPKIEWYCVGDADQIEWMVKDITHMGKKRSQGFGQIAKWEVEVWPEDLSHLRPVPDETGDDYVAIRPPYWYSKHFRRVVWPEDGRLGARKILAAY